MKIKNLFKPSLHKILKVSSSNGFHLRPIAKFVARSKSFDSAISMEFEHKKVDAKNLSQILSLSLEKNDTFKIVSKDKEALEGLAVLFLSLMAEDKEEKEIKSTQHLYSKVIKAQIISKGIVIAKVKSLKIETQQREILLNFREAMTQVIEDLNRQDNDIFVAQKELLLSVADKIDDIEAFEKRIEEKIASLKNSKLEAKIDDYKDLLQRVKAYIHQESKLILPQHPSILIADTLFPSFIEEISKSQVSAIVVKTMSRYSHSAILLKEANIPTLIADIKESDTEMIVDALSGVIVETPTQKDYLLARETMKAFEKEQDKAYTQRFEKTKIEVFANIADLPSAHKAKENGADGVGLFRSEFLFTKEKPSLSQQIQAYTEIFSLFEEMTIRTLDVGGDKKLDYIQLPKEDNPFLGIRGIRLLKTHPEIISEQLEAIFIASKDRPLKIMFPMISTPKEFREAKSFAKAVARKLEINISRIQFGMMIEVPSVLYMLEEFDKVVDFYSLGTNDLLQYLFAIDRTHQSLEIEDISILFKIIKEIKSQTTKPLSICGEIAGNLDNINQLIALELETISVSSTLIPQIKEYIRNV